MGVLGGVGVLGVLGVLGGWDGNIPHRHILLALREAWLPAVSPPHLPPAIACSRKSVFHLDAIII